MTNTELDLPFKSRSIPAALRADTQIRFRCHKGIPCFSACCGQADVTLTPYDVLRLKRRLGWAPGKSSSGTGSPSRWIGTVSPGLSSGPMRAGPVPVSMETLAVGCTRTPPNCVPMLPGGPAGAVGEGGPQVEERYSLVRRDHCKCHQEGREISIADCRAEQGCIEYDAHKRGWYQIILKKKPAGPAVGRPPPASLQVFFMASYDFQLPPVRPE